MSQFGNYIARAQKVLRNTENLIKQNSELIKRNRYLEDRIASFEKLDAVRERLQDKFEQSEEFKAELEKQLLT